MYESLRFKIPTTDFETQTTGVKLFGYWGVSGNNQPSATGAGPVELYGLIRNDHLGGPGTSIENQWNIDMYTQGVNSLAYPQNRNLNTKVRAGQWHHFEMYAKINTIGQNNGIWQWWLDGTLMGEYTDIVFITPAKPSGFYGITYNPVWGGQGGTPKTRTDYLWLDHLYLSGIYLRDRAPIQ